MTESTTETDYTADLKRDEATVRRGLWPKLRRVARWVPFSDDVLSAYYCAIDPKTPSYVKAVLMGAVAYFVVPTDLVPDFIAGLGFSDDATVMLTAISAVGGSIRDEHREKAAAKLSDIAEPEVSAPEASSAE